jgi:dTDP-4-dehydrorhamnose 3,5-epimerase
MNIRPTALGGLLVVEPAELKDERGSFSRLYCDEALAGAFPGPRIAQVNLSKTHRRGSIRGMHFQRPPMAEAKLVRCLRGRVFDVVVDVREGSSTFLHWHGEELAADSGRQLLIPPGCAHGFQTLDDEVEMLYLHSVPWSREHEGRLRYDDPRLAIAWPLPVSCVSPADRSAAALTEDFTGVLA